MAMVTRALAAAAGGRRATGQSGLAVLSSCCRRGGGGGAPQSFSHSSSSSAGGAELEGHADATATAAQVEAALNRKNVDVVQGDRSATLLPDEAAAALRCVGAGADADDAWVPDEETGVFVPADEASGNGNRADGSAPPPPPSSSSVLDQAVFVREEDMEDVERPAVTVDMTAAPNEHGDH